MKNIENVTTVRENGNLRNDKAITLIALVITIIVLLLLAGISINMLSGQDGILAKAQKSNMATELSQIQDKVSLEIAGKQVEQGTGFDASKYTNLEDFETEIKSKYSEYIGISNGKVYIKSNAEESLKQVAREIGIEIAEVGLQDEEGKINIGKVNDIKNYRIYGNTINKEKILPEEYEQVEYIKSTRTQFIDTGYIPKTNTKLEINLKFEGEFDNTKGKAFLGTSTDNNAFTVNFGSGEKEGNDLYFWIDKTYESGEAKIMCMSITDAIRENKNTLVIQSEHVEYGNKSRDVAKKTTDQTETLTIFGRKRHGEYIAFEAYDMYVYDLKIYEGEELKRNMIPCFRKEDNKVGMYDLVENKFYTNGGTGEFICSGEDGSLGEYNEEKLKYEIPVTVTGKNLLDINTLYTYNYSASGSLKINENSFTFRRMITNCTSATALNLFLKEGNYVISGTCSQEDGLNGGWGIYDNESGKYIENKSGTGYVRGSFTITESKEYRVAFFCNYNSVDGTMVEYNNIQIEEGRTSTEYEPYIEPVITNIYLDEPLRSNGEVADYIEFASKKLIRKIGSNGEILDTPIVEAIDLPDIVTINGTNIIIVDTSVKPSKVEIEY